MTDQVAIVTAGGSGTEAAAAKGLAGDGYITGQNIRVDVGVTRSV